MTDDVRIRPATAADMGSVSELVTALARRFITPDLGDEGRANLLASMAPEVLQGNLQQGFDVLVAERPVGHPAPGLVGVVATRDDSHLFHLFVAEPCHGTGLGRRLWEAARDRCVARAGTRRFTVFSSAYARPVYERLGFRTSGPVDRRGGVVSYPMELDLS